MLATFSKHIEQHFSFLKEKKLLIAISGGLDSVVLTHLCHSLDFSIALAHCNFGLRAGESEGDEAFVKKLGKDLGLPVFTKSFNTKQFATQEKVSIQVAARDLRYQWFKELVLTQNLDYLLTAHHADDNLETFLINLSRGTGLEGLTGIPDKNEYIARPLLPFSRSVIESYAHEHKLIWREDSSNTETKYLRNKIRHTVIPALKETNTSFLSTFNKTLENLKESKEIIEESIDNLKETILNSTEEGLVKIEIAPLLALSNPKAFLHEMLKNYGFTAWDDLQDLLRAQAGKQIVSASHRLVKDRDYLLLTPLVKETLNNVYQIEENDELLKTPDFTLIFSYQETQNLHTKNVVFLNRDMIKFPLHVRKWKSGDYFYPFGMEGKKKVSKFFKDEKLSLLEKEKIWLLCSGDDIIWVIGMRLDNRFKIDKDTKNSIKIESI